MPTKQNHNLIFNNWKFLEVSIQGFSPLNVTCRTKLNSRPQTIVSVTFLLILQLNEVMQETETDEPVRNRGYWIFRFTQFGHKWPKTRSELRGGENFWCTRGSTTRPNTRESSFWSKKECEGGNHVKAYACHSDFGPMTFSRKFLITWLKTLRSRDFGPHAALFWTKK